MLHDCLFIYGRDKSSSTKSMYRFGNNKLTAADHSEFKQQSQKKEKCTNTLTVVCLFLFQEVVKKKGLEHITVDDLVAEITPKGRGMVTSFT